MPNGKLAEPSYLYLYLKLALSRRSAARHVPVPSLFMPPNLGEATPDFHGPLAGDGMGGRR